MRRQVWSVEELRDILLAANEASGLSVAVIAGASEREAVTAYRQGFKAALVAVAIAVGLSPLADSLGGRNAH